MMTFEKETGHQIYVFIKRKTKQELNRRNARQNRAFITCSVHLRWYDVLIVPLTVLVHCTITNMTRTLSY